MNVIFYEQVNRCSDFLLHKGKEYATDQTDRLSSFKAAAVLQHCTQPEALCGMLSKHIVSIYDMCHAGSGNYDMAVWDEKITDALNYLFILKAIVKEEESHKQN